MNKELHPRSDVARLYVSRKNGGRGLIGCKNSVKNKENGLGWYVKNNIEPLLVAVRLSRAITIKNPRKLKKNKKQVNGLQKECMANLLEIWRTRIRTHGD